MGKHVHKLSNADLEAKTATCANCGPVEIVMNGTRPRCQVGAREADRRARERRNAAMTDEERAARKQWQKEYGAKWYIENRERHQELNKKYREEHADEIREQKKTHRLANREAYLARQKVYRERNREQIREGLRKWREQNPEYMRKWREENPNYCNEWRAANPEAVRGASHRRRERIKRDVTPEDKWFATMWRAHIKDDPCFYCGAKEGVMHDDHYIPLAKGGLDVAENLVRACPSCNQQKSSMMPNDFFARRDRMRQQNKES